MVARVRSIFYLGALNKKKQLQHAPVSRRTQAYLLTWLEDSGHKGQLVLLNGSDAGFQSQSVCKAWMPTCIGSSRISASKTADMKAALLEKFKSDEAVIRISTEAAVKAYPKLLKRAQRLVVKNRNTKSLMTPNAY